MELLVEGDSVPEPPSEFSDSGEVELVSFVCSEFDPAAVEFVASGSGSCCTVPSDSSGLTFSSVSSNRETAIVLVTMSSTL